MPWKHGLQYLPEPYRSLISELLDRLRDKFKDKLVSLVVYGSIARGDFRRDSDIDLLIIIEDLPKSKLKRQDLFMEVEEGLKKVIEEIELQGFIIDFSPILKTPEEARRFSPLYLDMVEDAIIVYDKDGFFKSILRRLEEKLRELGAKRIRIGKKWYWVLKDKYRFGEVISIE